MIYVLNMVWIAGACALRDPSRTSRIIATLMAAGRTAVGDKKAQQLVVNMGPGLQGVLDSTIRQAATPAAEVTSAAPTDAEAAPGTHENSHTSCQWTRSMCLECSKHGWAVTFKLIVVLCVKEVSMLQHVFPHEAYCTRMRHLNGLIMQVLNVHSLPRLLLTRLQHGCCLFPNRW